MSSAAIFLSIIIIMFIHLSLISCSFEKVGKTTNYGGCIPSEMKALLKFKESLIDPSMALSSWNRSSKDCCKWQGIMCDKFKEHVIGLCLGYEELFNEKFYYEPDFFEMYNLEEENEKDNEVELKRLKSNMLDASLLDLKHLTYLDMSGMDFSYSSNPPFLGSMEQLQYLNLSSASFSGFVPHHLGNLSNLRVLDLKRAYGLIFDDFMWVSRLSQLEHLDMSYVDLSSTKDLVKVLHMLPSLVVLILSSSYINNTNLKHTCVVNSSLSSNVQHLDLKLRELRISSFRIRVRFGWTPPFQLIQLTMQSCDIGGPFPQWLQMQKELVELRLSNCSISGTLPKWIHYMNLTVLDLSSNHIRGLIPTEIGYMLPRLRELRLSQIRNNEFYSTIPSQLCQMWRLQIIDLANNNLSGSIPLCIGNLSGMMENNYVHFVSLEERLNEVLKGLEQEYYYTTATYLVNFDISNNNLVGEIPIGLTNLTLLIGLNLSHNHLEGKIPGKIGELRSLESLDFSCNNLFGSIPQSLSDLSFLSRLNLSNNNLSGQIPTGKQLQTLTAEYPSIYDGNPQLCGDPLPKKCYPHKALQAPKMENHVAEDEGWSNVDKVWLYGFIISGFATGFWGVVGVLIFKISWRYAYFKFVERVSRMFAR